ncbi:hypothetical protein BDY21DRAFT_65096 [Lineolata rhizophorae]|uniref:Uncharacterized protein n=1 Tax=Lineolata rhizophorae TaxID=578093 RepID=A0A6A6NWY0_9PEZI|nr:hypothetical protein BDY21DRAFT_65096 [Lineolata rhizophorae]
MEWTKKQYNQQYDKWVPWLEDQYLYYFGKDNKASYVTKDQLSKTKVTGNKQVDTLQDDVNNLVGNQVGKGGLGEAAGNAVSKEGINRAERGGKDDQGGYAPGPAGSAGNPVAENAKSAGSGVMEGGKKAGGYVSGMWSGKK